MTKFTHLTYEDRIRIEDRLNEGASVRSIANILGKSPSTILREIERNTRKEVPIGNVCQDRSTCGHKHLCGNQNCNRFCSTCNQLNCNKVCNDYNPYFCEKLAKPPFVCNSCNKGKRCPNTRNYYHAAYAERKSRRILKETRQGTDLTEEQLKTVDELASPMIKKGLSPYHIKETYKDKLPVSEATLRRIIDRQDLSARNIDLRDKVKRKERKGTRNKDRIARLTINKLGHLYKDYLAYIEETETPTVEMDCVEGKKDETATLLTLTFRELSMQLAFIMDNQTSEDVVRVLDMIEESLGKELFATSFPIILTDNGHEFTDINGMERSIYDGGKRTKIYFCEPNRSDEKGTCENHHRMIRFVIPKGSSLEQYSQADISKLMNHINSYKRKALFGKSAYDVAMNVLPEDFFVLLGLVKIPSEEIILSKELFTA